MDFDEKDALETKEELESLKHKLFMEHLATNQVVIR